MKLLLFIFLTFNLYASDLNQSIISNTTNITSLQKEIDFLKKENIQLKTEIDKVEWKRSDGIDNINNRIESFGNHLELNSIIVGASIGIFGIFMTVLVIIITFRSHKEAKLVAKEEAENKIEKWINIEAKGFMKNRIEEVQEEIHKDTNKKVEELLNQYEEKIQKLQLGMENLQNQFEERGNELLNNLSVKNSDNNILDNELSIEDKQYFEYQIKSIKSKPLKFRTFQDYKKIIFFNILSNNYQRAKEDISKLLNKNYDNLKQAWLFYLEGLLYDKIGQYEKAISSYNKAR